MSAFLTLWLQDVKQGQKALWRFQDMILELLHKVRTGPPPEPHTLAAHLLAVRDPHTGGPLPEDHIISEVAILFVAGFETTGMFLCKTPSLSL